MKCNPVNSRLAGYSDLGQEEKATGLVEAPSMQDTDRPTITPYTDASCFSAIQSVNPHMTSVAASLQTRLARHPPFLSATSLSLSLPGLLAGLVRSLYSSFPSLFSLGIG
jgi:hypothetical protein